MKKPWQSHPATVSCHCEGFVKSRGNPSPQLYLIIADAVDGHHIVSLQGFEKAVAIS